MLLYKCITDMFQLCFLGFEFAGVFLCYLLFNFYITSLLCITKDFKTNKQTKRAQQNILYLNHAGQIMHD